MKKHRPPGNEPSTLSLINSIYSSILQPGQFVEILEHWDRNVTSVVSGEADVLNVLEEQITTAIPLLEESLRSVVNEDELLNRLASLERPGMLVSGNGVVVGVNQGGQGFFGLQAGDRFSFGRLDRSTAAELKDLIDNAGRHSEKEGFKVIRLASSHDSANQPENLVACRSIAMPGNPTGYVLMNAVSLVFDDTGMAAFQSAFGATDAEMRILDHLLSGRRQKDIAQEDGIREDTVKKHISSLREKASVANTTALVCLAAGFAQLPSDQGRISEANGNGPRSVTNGSGQTYTAPLRHRMASVDGCRVEYVDEGPRDGKPVLFHHSSLMSYILPPEFIHEFCEAGYRLIVPFRPGYGLSDPLPNGFSLENVAKHWLKFADTIGLGQFHCLAGTMGLAYAAQLADLAGERVRGVVGIAGYLPVDRQVLHATTARYQRALIYTEQRNRKLAKFLALSGYKLVLQMGAKSFFSQTLRNSKSDLRVVGNSNSLGALSVGLRISCAQGVDSFLNDVSLVLKDWTDLADSLKTPVHLLHGEDDDVFILPIIEEFCADRENFSLTVVPDQGQLMIYDDPVHIASLIIEKFEGMSDR